MKRKKRRRRTTTYPERRYGTFTRSFSLPDVIDTDKIGAEFKKGVLTVTLPKKAETMKPERKIEVKAG